MADTIGLLNDLSGTIAVAGTAQYATAAPTINQGQFTRTFLLIHNPDTSVDLWYNFDTPAVAGQPSIRLPAGQTHFYDHFVPAGRLSVLSATINKPFVVKVGGGA